MTDNNSTTTYLAIGGIGWGIWWYVWGYYGFWWGIIYGVSWPVWVGFRLAKYLLP